MDFGLVEMQVVALTGLLAIASVAAWSSATLWRRQRNLERMVFELVARLDEVSSREADEARDEDPHDASTAVRQLVALLKAADRSALEETLRPPLDLSRTPAIDVDGAGGAPGGRFGHASAGNRTGWEA